MNHLRFLKGQLYSLKREYGVSISIYRNTVGDSDLITGEKSITRISYDIKRAIVMPIKFETTQFYTAAYLKFAREFAYGASKDINSKRIIVDGSDLPKTFELKPEDSLVYSGKRFEIKFLERLEYSLGYQLVAQELTGTPPNQIINLKITDNIRFLDRLGII